MSLYTRNVEELLYLTTQKIHIVQNLKKNYKENIHYIIENNNNNNYNNIKKYGGHNKINYLLTEEAFELLKNSFNLRNKYIVNVIDNVKQINLCMPIENQTIGFIWNCFNEVTSLKRQYKIHTYSVDLYFLDYKLVIECDEYGHTDRDPNYEKTREEYITALGNKIIRFNPNIENFDLSNVVKDINKVIFKIN